LRFIPACAGNGIGPSIRNTKATVHPRVCGERALAATAPLVGCGSSPRVRGTVAARPKNGR